MRRVLKWVFPAFLSILPTWGAEQAGPDAAFLNKLEIKSCRITDVHEDEVGDEVKLFASVEVELQTGEKAERRVPASFTPVGWDHNDEKKFSRREGVAYVFCKGKRIEMDYIKAERHKYQPVKSTKANLLAGQAVQDMDIPLGVKVDMSEHSEHKRKDGSIHELASVVSSAIVEAEMNGKKVKQADLLQLPNGTSLDVMKSVYSDSGAINLSHKNLIYKLHVQEKSTSREAWICTKEEQQITYAGGFFKNPKGTLQTRHFPSKYLLTDYWTEVYKVALTSPEQIPFLKGDIHKRTKKLIEAGTKDVGHCDGKFTNYETVH